MCAWCGFLWRVTPEGSEVCAWCGCLWRGTPEGSEVCAWCEYLWRVTPEGSKVGDVFVVTPQLSQVFHRSSG